LRGNENLPALEFIKTRQESAQAGFPRAGVPDKRNGLTGLNRQVKVSQHGLPSVIL
jgi:hypothetical protein